MRNLLSIPGVVSILIGAAVASTTMTPVLAQSNPSADDIIKLLKPSGTIGNGTRGIRPAANPAPDAAAPASPAPQAYAPAAPAPVARPAATAAAAPPRPPVQAAPAAPSANIEVQFASNSAELTPAARASLDQLGRALSSSDLAAYKFRIEGHTDTVGSPDSNKSLSARRADAVVEYLATTYRVDRARMQPVGKGSEDLAVATGPQVSEPRNRRVQVVNIGT